MLQMIGIRKVCSSDGPEAIIREIALTQEDVRFVSANTFAPLNKLSQIVVTPHVHVLFSDTLKGQLALKLQQMGANEE